MCALTNYDLFEELFDYIKDEEVTLEDALKEFGGSNYYIPSYKTTGRNDEINEKYLQMQRDGKSRIAKLLSNEYDLSEAQIYAITKQARQEVNGNSIE